MDSAGFPEDLPTELYVYGSGANAMCAGGRATPTPCRQAPASNVPARPQVTSGVVMTALRRIGLPALRVRTQPEDKTLVNFATNFYARPRALTRNLTLHGQRVQVRATPSTFTWHYGDGVTNHSEEPGAPYPALDITHDYTEAHVTVQPSVDVTYVAHFRVGGGPWQAIPGAVTITGPPSPLRVSEATAVLSGDY